jgi:hypothetical protein
MRRIRVALEPFLTFIASMITIAFAWYQCADVTTPAGRYILDALLLLIVVLLVILGSREFRYSRKARYAEIICDLNQIFFDIQAAASRPNISQAEIVLTCQKVVDTLSRLLSLITATHVSACVKMIDGIPSRDARWKVITLCRDPMSAKVRNNSADLWIDQNTAFEDVLNLAGSPNRCFFANYLPWLRGYKNSSFGSNKPYEIPIPMIGDIVRNATWTLPYRSTIVAPITPSAQQASDTQHRFSGYLCVDSRSLGVFRRRFDEDIVVGVANCLYELAHRYSTQSWNSETVS